MNKEKIYSYIIPVLVLLGLIISGAVYLLGMAQAYSAVLMVTLIVGTLPLLWRMLQDVFRGHFGVDIIAITAIVASFFLRQYLAGGVILLMLSGGEALEAYALQRARRELTDLMSNAPSIAHIKRLGAVADVPVKEVKIGDEIIIKPGEVVPVDGLVIDGESEVDESALTGEALPVKKSVSSHLLSGSINKDKVLEIKALRAAAESKYEQIIRLVREAESAKAPVVRLADRYSVWFTAITFILGALSWYLSHDPIRLLAVLVVATPCPLILATPIAMISGISRAASRGIIVKNGGALEKLAEVKAFIFDKTGTLTLGLPEVAGVKTYGIDEAGLLKLAASLDQLSTHILAKSLTSYAVKTKNTELEYPEHFQEFFGDGVVGTLQGRVFRFGKLDFLKSGGVGISQKVLQEHEDVRKHGKIAVYLSEGDRLLGAVYFADVVRPETKKLFGYLKSLGLDKIIMLTGDKKEVAEKIAAQIGITDIHAEALPENKVYEVKDHKKQFGSVAMVGDGVNDAPALASADVGISIGGHGSNASSDTSDIVITIDNLERIGEAFTIARRVMLIAKQGIFAGIGLSIFLMFMAAYGYIQPVYGALLQELIDVAVILNALRVIFEKV